MVGKPCTGIEIEFTVFSILSAKNPKITYIQKKILSFSIVKCFYRIGTVNSFKNLCDHHFATVKDILCDRTIIFGGTESGLSLGNAN